jgi:hypothetical protein
MYCNVLTKFEKTMKRMKTKILILLAIPVMFYACKKDTYTSKPQLSIKSINSTVLKQGDLLYFQIQFTDAEGDIQDTLWVQKVSRTCPTTFGVQFTSKNKVPDFTPTSNLVIMPISRVITPLPVAAPKMILLISGSGSKTKPKT